MRKTALWAILAGMMSPARMGLHVACATAALCLSACYDDSVYTDLVRLTSSRETATSTGAGESAGPTTVTWTGGADTDGSSVGDSTGAETGATSSGGEGKTGGGAGLEVSLSVTPEILYAAGFVELTVEHDSAAVLLELWDEIDDEQPRASWTPDEPAPPYLITRGTERALTIRAYDDEGNVGISDVATVELQLPDPGATLWEQTIEHGAVAQGRAVAAGYLKSELAIATGLDSDNKALVGRHSSVGAPGLFAPPGSGVSTTTGVALLPDGWILATGVDVIGLAPRSWLARVNPFTAEVVVLDQGDLGDVATGLAVDLELERVYISGHSTPKGAEAADARIWARSLIGGDLIWTRVWERPVDFDDEVGRPNDLGLAVAVLDNHDPVLVGETRFLPGGMDPVMQHWAFVHRYDASGGFDPKSKSWTSPEIFNAAGAYAVARDDDNGLLVAGWTSQNAKTSRQATILAFDPLLTEAQFHDYGPTGFWNAKGVARLQTGDIVYLTDADIDDQGRHDFEVRGIDKFTFGTASWTKAVTGEKGARAAGLTVTPEGHIVIIGTSIREGGTSLILQGLHP